MPSLGQINCNLLPYNLLAYLHETVTNVRLFKSLLTNFGDYNMSRMCRIVITSKFYKNEFGLIDFTPLKPLHTKFRGNALKRYRVLDNILIYKRIIRLKVINR